MKKSLIMGFLVFMFCLPTPAVKANLLQTVSPTFKEYVEWTDFLPLQYTGFGDVTALLQAAGRGATADFVGFTPGNIALIERGDFTFREKVLNAEKAGALGAIIYNHDLMGGDLFLGTLGGPGISIPTVGTSRDVGLELLDFEAVMVHLLVDHDPAPIPEPATILLLGSGLIGLAGFRRKFMKR